VQEAIDPPTRFNCPERFNWVGTVAERQLSITELEIFHGILGRDENTNGCVTGFVYFRDDTEFMPKCPDDLKWIFDFEQVTEQQSLRKSSPEQYSVTEAAPKIKSDFDWVNKSLQTHASRPGSGLKAHTYTPSSINYKLTRITKDRGHGRKHGTGYIEVPELLGNQIYVDLFSSITEQYPVPTRRLDVWRLEAVYHKTMLESSNECFGRDELLQEVGGLIHDDELQKPVIVVGQPGSGKTTVTCAAIKNLVQEDAQEKIILFYHIVASSAQSFSLKNMLQRLCRCLKRKANLKIELPSTIDALKDTWIHFAIMASKLKPVVIVLDAINQLSPDHAALDLAWIPHSLPNSNVKILCTMIKDDVVHKRFAKRGGNSPHVVNVLPMEDAASKTELVATLLQNYRKELSKPQMNILLSKEDSGSPLFLFMACQKLLQAQMPMFSLPPTHCVLIATCNGVFCFELA
jgi:hypothetical protein